MKKKLITILILISFNIIKPDNKVVPVLDIFHTKWAICGFGVAGIAAFGTLVECQVPLNDITLIDPEFSVGRIGKYYGNVPANSKIKDFITFINSCRTFKECPCPALSKLKLLNPEIEPPLKVLVEPLLEISQYFTTKVKSLKDKIESLYFENNVWHIGTSKAQFTADNVILATGSHPKVLDYECGNIIPLDIALDPYQLKNLVKPEDNILVVGSSHSAILILKYLSQIPVRKIINLYNKPIRYVTNMGTWTLYDNSGLRGLTAKWAKEVLEKNPPLNLLRLFNDEQNRTKSLKEANKIIYAIGFERNELPKLKDNPNYQYNENSGIIAPRLFGIGIAFPDKTVDPLGNVEHNISLNSFIFYAQQIVPYWLNCKSETRKKLYEEIYKKIGHLNKFEDLLQITML